MKQQDALDWHRAAVDSLRLRIGLARLTHLRLNTVRILIKYRVVP